MNNDPLSIVVNIIDEIINDLNSAVDDLISLLSGHKITAKTQEYIHIFSDRYNEYLKNRSTNSSFDLISSSASAVQTYASALVSGLAKSPASNDENIKKSISKVLQLSDTLKKNIEEREVVFSSEDHETKQYDGVSSKIYSELSEHPESYKKYIDSLKNELILSEDRHQKRESLLSARLEELDKKLSNLEEDVKKRIDAVDSLYLEAESSLEEKQNSVDNLLGTISEGVIAKDYDSNASGEKKTADLLRVGSLICMFTIAVVVGFSLYETTIESFRWENAIFRLVFTILLSIPAAYLARESAKHRDQQYTHLQTSLDLKAISPYLASLPVEEQHRLKSEIANRLFVPKDYKNISPDTYPINSHELLIKLLDKFDFKSR